MRPEPLLTAARGIVQIGAHTLELPEDQARTLFLLAGATSGKGGGPIVISSDTTVVVTRCTPISITISGGFEEAHDPAADLARTMARRGRRTATEV